MLLENRTWCGEGFVDVSIKLSQPLGDDFCTLSASWADVDYDGWPDLFAWDPATDVPTSRSRLWMNQQGGGFIESFAGRFVTPAPLGLSSATVRDVSGDPYVDVLFATSSGVTVRHGVFGVFGGDQPIQVGQNFNTAAAQVFDHDLDGVLDIMSIPHTSDHSVHLLKGALPYLGSPVYHDVTTEVDLSESGPMLTVQNVDMTGDGDADLYTGKPAVSGGRFFSQNQNVFGGEDPLSRWYGIRLVGDGGTNVAGIGAEVILEFEGHTVHHRVCPDWGLGSGASGVIRVGLGVEKALGTGHVIWPDGSSQDFVPILNGVKTVEDSIAPAYVANTLSVTTVATEGGQDLVLQWETSNAVDPARTQVLVTNLSGSNCNIYPTVMYPEDAFADYSISMDLSGVYSHKFIWHGDCVPRCNYSVRVKCETNSGEFMTESRLLKVPTCLIIIWE